MVQLETDKEFVVAMLAVSLLVLDKRRMDIYKEHDRGFYDEIMKLHNKFNDRANNIPILEVIDNPSDLI